MAFGDLDHGGQGGLDGCDVERTAVVGQGCRPEIREIEHLFQRQHRLGLTGGIDADAEPACQHRLTAAVGYLGQDQDDGLPGSEALADACHRGALAAEQGEQLLPHNGERRDICSDLHQETKVGDLCRELGVTRQTLYRHVSPAGELRADGVKLLARG